MKQILHKLIPYSIILVLVFLLIPFVTKMDTRIESMITLLIVLNPIACLGAGAIFGIKHGFKPYFLMLVALLSLTSIYVFYGDTALIYVVLYLIFSAAGLGIGCAIRKFSKA